MLHETSPRFLETPYADYRTPSSAQRTYNVTAMSFTPAQLAASIQRVVPGFRMTYLPDFREGIARSWPASIDDSAARADWGWRPAYALDVRLNCWLPHHTLHDHPCMGLRNDIQ